MHYDPSYRRLVPEAGPEHFKTYAMRAPLSSHWRRATCEEYECKNFLNGFELHIDTSTELGQKQFHYVTKVDKIRTYKMMRTGPHTFTFRYGPGNDCFEPQRSSHRVPIGRPPLLLVAEGDFRGNPRKIPVRKHVRVEDWVDDFSTHEDRLATARQRG